MEQSCVRNERNIISRKNKNQQEDDDRKADCKNQIQQLVLREIQDEVRRHEHFVGRKRRAEPSPYRLQVTEGDQDKRSEEVKVVVSPVFLVLLDFREQERPEKDQQLHPEDRIHQPFPACVGRVGEIRRIPARNRPQIQARALHDQSGDNRKREQDSHLAPLAVVEMIFINIAQDENQSRYVEQRSDQDDRHEFGEFLRFDVFDRIKQDDAGQRAPDLAHIPRQKETRKIIEQHQGRVRHIAVQILHKQEHRQESKEQQESIVIQTQVQKEIIQEEVTRFCVEVAVKDILDAGHIVEK